ncbi:replication-relaxation family protein [Burkholderia pseudomallei]|uniref:replication-relaxation family protein n=1 Tax=Burkholderia pseudomallei TaxID=28450 RepID=UPI00052A8E62|nr:replication-relaxation family protein [Burkholderia pseudomallei]AIV53351.1 hypothetical protein Y603_2474 [Burkholderia pseudomallei MSHR1153]KGS58656.1 hypothetical protein X949_2541 [Burkholderia pseudomallei MSHR5609]KGX60726.1 hypothetical protein Y024_3365 [Burkholderia pseudomallei TSV44]KIX37471.1 hypothetical protein SZ28_18860 [Burkholderia pseudomallei]MBO2979052.1 hypothetical protein [Burkholderia pseudomallei]
MTAQDGRITASQNEVRVLRALNRFGWLSTKSLAVLLWQPWLRKPAGEPDMRPLMPTATARLMAQRTLRRLYEAHQVLRARAPDGSWIYVLAEAGVRRLAQHGVPASSGKDLVRRFSASQFRHRSVANDVALASIVAGFRVSTEREIAVGKWLGGEQGIADKKPDVLLQGNGQVWWVEVEKSRRNKTDQAKLHAFLNAFHDDANRADGPILLGGPRWAKVIFICTPAFRIRLVRELEKSGWSAESVKRLIAFVDDTYHFTDIAFQ